MEWIKIFITPSETRSRLLENKPRLLVVHGKRICLVLHNNKAYAVGDTCPHNGESLSRGSINQWGEIICPWHGYRYQLKNGRESSERCRDLETYPTKEDETGFYIGM
jgi:3-phenylpropionate/trans-cinnamate dioxygenase ferredoxin subunit